MPTNFWMFFLTALIPLIIGFIWYHESLFGKKWMQLNGFKKEELEKSNMLPIFIASYFFGVLLSFGLSGLVVHQTAVFQMMMPDVMEQGSKAAATFNELMASYGTYHRSYGHGAIHGLIFALFLFLPSFGINAIFERRGWKYIFIHLGYWIVSCALIGAVLSAHLSYV